MMTSTMAFVLALVVAPTAAASAPQTEMLSIVFVPNVATDPMFVVDFQSRAEASGVARKADIAWLSTSEARTITRADDSTGTVSAERELLPTPASARATVAPDGVVITFQNMGDWQGKRPVKRKPGAPDGPSVVVSTTARLALEGSLLDLARDGTSISVPASLFGTWREVPGTAVIRRGHARKAAFVVVQDRSTRVVDRVASPTDAPFVVDTRLGCDRVLPVAAVFGWREPNRKTARRAQVSVPTPWACRDGDDIARIIGETRRGTRRVPLHGIWIRTP